MEPREIFLNKVRTVYDPVLDVKKGDWVRKFQGQQVFSPYIGIITNVVPSLGIADVEWPFGNRREDVYWLVLLNKEQSQEKPITMGDTSYTSYDNP